MVPLQGVRFESGTADTLSWHVRVLGDTATGSLSGTYRELEVRVVDRGEGSTGPPDVVRSLLADIVLEEEREPDENPSVGIRRAIPPGTGLWAALWLPARAGLRSLLGL